jgi:UDP-N-acetylglucosamine 1-carboxyvinyltransferase
MPDRNEAVTFGIAALATGGDIFVEKANPRVLQAFLEKVKEIGGNYQVDKEGIRFWRKDGLKASEVKTAPYPGFMTDWQALWTVLMTQAKGESIVHETIFENRFGYVSDLVKIGAKIKLFNPQVKNPEGFYNFNWPDNQSGFFHAAGIFGPTPLRGGHFTISDIRAGATLILAALVAKGKTELLEVEHVDRGYEAFDLRLRKLGARIKRIG